MAEETGRRDSEKMKINTEKIVLESKYFLKNHSC